MTDPVSVVLVGIGGYGEVYLQALLEDPRGAGCRIVGGVDPHPESCSRLKVLEEMKVPLFSSLDAFYEKGSAELAVLSSPIQLHAPHTALALEHGSHVLVEKPAAAVTADVDRMVEARDGAGRFVAVGFQWSFSDAVLALKRDILDRRFGAPLWGRSLTLWPRTEAYYRRNGWAGRKRDDEGRWILDSPASNAMAHHLHNLLFLLGPELDRSAEAMGVEARLARVNSIETFDSIGARMETSAGAEILFLASHAISLEEAVDPRFTLAFEKGILDYPGGMAPMTFRFHDGHLREYPAPDTSSQVRKLWVCADAVRRWKNGTRDNPKGGLGSAEDTGGDPAACPGGLRAGARARPGLDSWRGVIPCGLETSRPHTAFVEGLERSGVEPFTVPPEEVGIQETEGGRLRYVPGQAAALTSSYTSGELPKFPGGAA